MVLFTRKNENITFMEVAVTSSWMSSVKEALQKNGTSPAAPPAAEKEAEAWRKRCIYRVPACIKDLNPRAYVPQVVSFGPFHHGADHLLPMEEHKRRALLHFLRRRPGPELDDYVAAMAEIAEELEGAYEGLGAEWSRERLVELMILDGCFLLEVIRVATGRPHDYAENDPIFSRHGMLYAVSYIKRDALMVENQLPLLALDRLIAVETGKPANADGINRMVLKFLAPSSPPPTHGTGLGLHPLDIFRKSLLQGPVYIPRRRSESPASSDIIRSAVELYEAGIQLKKSKTDSLHDIRFHRGVLTMPAVIVDDATEYMFLNLMAFERLHVGAGNEVTAYVFFMDNIIDSAKDVSLLSSKGIIQNAVGSDKAVAKLFNALSKDVVLDPESTLDEVHRLVNAYCRQPWNMWRANLIHTYFRSPWAFLSLAAAVFLLVMTVMQTVYTVLSYYASLNGSSSSSPSIAPSPM